MRDARRKRGSTEKITYATICEALIRDTLRNKLIVQDTADLLAQGHTPLVLTERLEHAKILAVALRPHCSHVFLLSGQGTAKEKRALLTELVANTPVRGSTCRGWMCYS